MTKDEWLVAYTRCADELYGQTKMKRAIILAKINHPWNRYNMHMSDHGQPRYQIWIKSNKRRMTSCVHKMCGRTVWSNKNEKGYNSSKNQPSRNRYNMHMSYHGQPRYQIWIKCDKRQMTSCVHKMCGRTYGQTNMKRATTLAKINHPRKRYMRMLRSWPTKIPNMNKMHQKAND